MTCRVVEFDAEKRLEAQLSNYANKDGPGVIFELSKTR